jgi:hypothetical protein
MEDIEKVTPLVRLASAVDDRPTLAEMDAMLGEMSKLPQNQAVRDIQDSMLDMRADIVESLAS